MGFFSDMHIVIDLSVMSTAYYVMPACGVCVVHQENPYWMENPNVWRPLRIPNEALTL